MSRFLKFVVEETVEGRSERIKEYAIALEVFDKDESYDPQADSTVRTEASKLRSRLARYYESEGRDDAVRISIPKGAYVPVFDAKAESQAAGQMSRSQFRPALAAAVITVVAGIWVYQGQRAPATRATLLQLTSYPELEEHPALSPDGSHVAFSWKGDIYVQQVGGDGTVQVTRNPGVESRPAWSPDGRQLAFVRGGEVLLAPGLGGNERRIVESPGPVAWMPDGSGLLVTCKFAGNALSICLVSLANGDTKRLTFPHDRSTGDVDMAVSPDGRTLAFKRVVVQNGEIHVMPVSGGQAHQITNDNRPILGLTWTPDGKELVYSSGRTGWSRLWRISAEPPDRAGRFRVPEPVEGAGDDARFPSISRPAMGRAARLVYQRHTRDFDIRRAEIVGREATQTHSLQPSVPLITSTRMDFTPASSPDGKKIAFVSDRTGARELWIADMDGSNPLRLTAFGRPDVILPRWSPDGQTLVFNALTGPRGNFESYTISARGGNPRRVTAVGDAVIAHPVFSPDGHWLYFASGPLSGTVDAWRMPSTGGAAVRITTRGAFRPEPSPDGKSLYYGKLGTKDLWSIRAEGGEERLVLDSIAGVNWTVTSHGIYYFDFAVPPRSAETGKLLQLSQWQGESSGHCGTDRLDRLFRNFGHSRWPLAAVLARGPHHFGSDAAGRFSLKL
jgi:Tol biopolymer transport system component